jgi:hypothetical protein
MDMLRGIADRYTHAWGDPVSSQAAALKQVWLMAYREAQVQAFADAYFAIAMCFAVSVFMVPFMRKVVPPKVPARQQETDRAKESPTGGANREPSSRPIAPRPAGAQA